MASAPPPPASGEAPPPGPRVSPPAEDDPGDGERRAWVRQLAALGHVGMMFPVAIAIGFLGGRWLDGRLGTSPWLSLVGFALGVAAALRNLIQSIGRLDEQEAQERDAEIERRRRARRDASDPK